VRQMSKEKILEYVELDEHTSIQKLSLLDQLRVLLRRITYDESNELKRMDVETVDYLRKRSNLLQFLLQATEPLRKGQHKTVEVQISSKFDTVLKEVLSLERFTEYYHIEIQRPELEYNIHHYITVRFEII
jgi:hypothetical protein